MKKTICLFLVLCCIIKANAQYKISCGTQTFTINAKKLSTVKQIDPETKAVIITTYFYQIDSNKINVWMKTEDSVTRAFTAYEIKKNAIDVATSQQIVDFGQQDYTEPVKTLYIKCVVGNKDVSVINYVDWTNNADMFPWSFIYVSSYNTSELKAMLDEINIWVKQ